MVIIFFKACFLTKRYKTLPNITFQNHSKNNNNNKTRYKKEEKKVIMKIKIVIKIVLIYSLQSFIFNLLILSVIFLDLFEFDLNLLEKLPLRSRMNRSENSKMDKKADEVDKRRI